MCCACPFSFLGLSFVGGISSLDYCKLLILSEDSAAIRSFSPNLKALFPKANIKEMHKNGIKLNFRFDNEL